MEKVTNLSNVQKKIDHLSQIFFFFFLKNNDETNKQKQNISLDPKKNLLDTQHGKVFKGKQGLKIQFFAN